MNLIKPSPEYVVYKICKLLDQNVATLDPLGLNTFFAKFFPEMSEKGKVQQLVDFITMHIHQFGHDRLLALSDTEAMAATRDLAMFASAFVRWGNPVSKVPVVERLLENLARKTQEVPADTVFSYGSRNPRGETMRRFTTIKEELVFIEAFTKGMEELPVCLAGLEHLSHVSVFDPIYPLVVSEVRTGFSNMVREITVVRQRVPPEIFTKELRPFFEPKTIAGKVYFAPGGAQMPVTMMDLMLWGVEETSNEYVRYLNENVQYLPRAMRSKIGLVMRNPSIVKSIETVCGENASSKIPQAAIPSIDAVCSLLTEMEKFRYPHLAVAQANMKIRTKGAVGSGGYDTAILEYLIARTGSAKGRLATLKSRLAKK